MLILQGVDAGPVAGRVEAVEHAGRGEDERTGAHAEDTRSGVVLAADPSAKRCFGLTGRLAQRRDHDQVGCQRRVGVHVGERVRGDHGGPALQGSRAGAAATT